MRIYSSSGIHDTGDGGGNVVIGDRAAELAFALERYRERRRWPRGAQALAMHFGGQVVHTIAVHDDTGRELIPRAELK